MTQPAPRLQSWAESWWRAIADLGRATHERREVVLQEVQVGSVPTLTYYALLGISELIAGFALIIDSDATLIGANIVAPLMTPIFGIALGLVRGDLRGIARARSLSRATVANIRENLFFAFVYNSLGVPVAAGALYPFFGLLLSPMLAAAAMSASSVSVIANALRLRRAAT